MNTYERLVLRLLLAILYRTCLRYGQPLSDDRALWEEGLKFDRDTPKM